MKSPINYLNGELVAEIRRLYDGKMYLFQHHGRSYSRTAWTHRLNTVSWCVQKKNIGYHTCRNSCAQHAITHGMDIKFLAAWLGHSSVATTGDLYLHSRLSWRELLFS